MCQKKFRDKEIIWINNDYEKSSLLTLRALLFLSYYLTSTKQHPDQIENRYMNRIKRIKKIFALSYISFFITTQDHKGRYHNRPVQFKGFPDYLNAERIISKLDVPKNSCNEENNKGNRALQALLFPEKIQSQNQKHTRPRIICI